MIPSADQTRTYIGAAWRLFRLDAAGFARVDGSEAGFWQSFWCAVPVAPLWAMGIYLRVLAVAASGAADPLGDGATGPSLWRVVAVQAIAYVIAWVAYPLAMAYIVRLLDRGARYFGYFAAYNWTIAPLTVLTVAIAALQATGLFAGGSGATLDWIAFGYSTVVLWFLARRGLDVPPGTAALIVAIDTLLNLLVFAVAGMLLR